MAPDDAASSSLTSDPLLSAFLSPTFSPTAYLNSTLPPLNLSTSNASTNISADNLSLAALHAKSTTHLSTLDVHLNRLQSTLTSLTDDILRATPRLGYEVEVLRSDVLNLAETITDPSTLSLLNGLIDEDLADVGKGNEAVKLEGIEGKPEVLTKLEMLVKVRGHLEEVISIFGQAMEWSLPTPPPASLPVPTSSYAPPSRSSTPAPATSTTNIKPTGSAKIEQEISFLLVSDQTTKATARVEELDKLCVVFKGTTEYAARVKFVEGLKWRIIEAGRGEEESFDERRIGRREESREREHEKEEEGWSGLVNQFQRMRGVV